PGLGVALRHPVPLAGGYWNSRHTTSQVGVADDHRRVPRGPRHAVTQDAEAGHTGRVTLLDLIVRREADRYRRLGRMRARQVDQLVDVTSSASGTTREMRDAWIGRRRVEEGLVGDACLAGLGHQVVDLQDDTLRSELAMLGLVSASDEREGVENVGS